MTRDEILKIPAGREMDALVAEKVMGWDKPNQPGWKFAPDVLSPPVGSTGRDEDRTYRVPRYSTDIAAAWQVVERLGEMDRYPTIHYGPDEYCGSLFYWVGLVNPADINICAETAPLVFCRAALLAVTQV